MKFRLNSSTGFILAAALVFVLGYVAWRAWAAYSIGNYDWTSVEPGEVSLIAIHPSAGYRIIVTNQVAHLAEVQNTDFEAPDSDIARMATSAERLPIRELIESLQGDEEALRYLVMTLNDMKPDEVPTGVPVWTAEDLRRAFAGNVELRAKLERDLHINLDGTPFTTYRVSAQAGIVVESPVEVQVPVGGALQTLEARIREKYVPLLYKNVQRAAEEADKFVTETDLVGFYQQEATAIFEGQEQPEDVAGNLKAMIDPNRLQSFARRPEVVLSKAEVVLNQSHIEGASSSSYDAGRNTYYAINIELTPDGTKRLWKYSREHEGFQLLLIVDGVAVAAPRISTELAQSSVQITQLEVKSLVESAVKAMNEASS